MPTTNKRHRTFERADKSGTEISDEPWGLSLYQLISLLLHLIWTHMQVGEAGVGVGLGWRTEGGKERSEEGRKDRREDDAIHNNKKKNKQPWKEHIANVNPSAFFLFLWVTVIFIFRPFNTSLMPQLIKIQSLLEINNTENIQRILGCFTVRVLTTSRGRAHTGLTVGVSQVMDSEDWGRGSGWVSSRGLHPPHPSRDKGNELWVCLDASQNELCRMLQCSITPHRQRAQQ